MNPALSVPTATPAPVLDALKVELEHRGEGICSVWLFGSVARGEARPGSDLDVAVLFETDPPHTLEGLHLDLADALSVATGWPVDLVVLNRAPVDLIHRVLRDGVLLLDHNPSARIRADEHLGEPESNAELFGLLVRNHWVPESLSGPLRAMAGFRNILVHGYQSVDKDLVRDVVEHRLDDLLAFVSAIRNRLIP